jgi:triosephosphate isomerase
METPHREVVGPRLFFIGANWKENETLDPLTDLVLDVINPSRIDSHYLQVVIAPSVIHIPKTMELLRRDIGVAAQTCSPYSFGAYTGEVSTEMLKDFGVQWVLVGHSERRKMFGETNEVVAMKLVRSLSAGLNVILCIGETLEERQSGLTMESLHQQLEAALPSISNWRKVVIAYEPLWAIGTGRTATPEQAHEVHFGIRKWVRDRTTPHIAEALQIIYGGSVSEENCKSLMLQPDIDGFLIGGASLKPGFRTILEVCNALYVDKYGGN